ncbi:MAG: sulfite exporter TauE/SafE family protein [Deferribacterota bacterium]|nr:sulfite exporter TauE/SafE family protein [Deferribacterota bacterium]
MYENIILLSTGIIGGILGFILGIGGGIIIMPVLVLLLGYPFHAAVPASLLAIVANSSVAAANNIEKGNVNIPLGLTLECATVFFAIVGGFLSLGLNEKYLIFLFSIAVLILAIIYIRDIFKNNNENDIKDYKILNLEKKTYFSDYYYDEIIRERVFYNAKNIPISILFSSIAGILSSMLGIGGGFLKVPAMNLISKMPIKAATATSNFMISLTASAGALVYILYGDIDLNLISVIVIGVFIGSQISNRYFSKVRDVKVKILFTIILFVMAIQMFLKAFFYE